MGDRTNHIGFAVSPREKAAIRQAAAAEDKSMAEFVRGRVLDNITPAEPDVVDEQPSPLQDFITARVHRDREAEPIPKRAVYKAYRDFCADAYPAHDVESQHKVSREIGALDGVDSGRRYIDNGDGLEQTRCFTGFRWAVKQEPTEFS